MDQVLKACGIAIVAVLAGLVIKKENPSGALLLSVAAGLAVLMVFLVFIVPILRFVDEVAETADLSPAVVTPLLKTLGISVVTRLSSDACKDAKEGLLSTCVDLTGTAAALYVALPLLQAVLSLTRSYLIS